MRELLDKHVGITLNEDSDEFALFSCTFCKLYVTIIPGDSATNRGKGTKENLLKTKALNNRLKKLEKYGLYYSLAPISNGSCGIKQITLEKKIEP